MDADVSVKRLSVIGLGKLGAPIAAALATRGFDVVGMDHDGAKVQAIQQGVPPVFEPGLPELLEQAKGRLTATQDLERAVLTTQASLVIVPTPSDADDGFSLKYLLPVCRSIGQALRRKDDYHLVVVTSTVMPGSTGGPILEALERSSGKACGEKFGLCYSPEFVALGSVARDFLQPDLVLIGQHDRRAGDVLEAIARQTAATSPGVARMNLVNAELAKIAVNSYVTTKITFANMIASICSNLPQADVDTVTAALGMDSRIGGKYLKGAIGYGGPCFPRDNRALAAVARRVGAGAELAESVDRVNRGAVDRLVNLVSSQVEPGQTVAVLGLAYKPGTDVVEQSQGLLLAAALAERGIDVMSYDPAAMDSARAVLGDAVGYARDFGSAVQASDVVVVTTPWPAFTEMTGAMLRRTGSRRVVIDCWRCLDGSSIQEAADYVAIGQGPREADRSRWSRVA